MVLLQHGLLCVATSSCALSPTTYATELGSMIESVSTMLPSSVSYVVALMGTKAFVELQQSVADIPEGQMHKVIELCKEGNQLALLEIVEEGSSCRQSR